MNQAGTRRAVTTKPSAMQAVAAIWLGLFGILSLLGCSVDPGGGEAERPRSDAVRQALSDCVMQVVAHEDDDIIFMSPELLNDVRARRCVRTVFITAGDGGDERDYWEGREAGARAAYATMAGVADDWTTTDAGIAGHRIPMQQLRGTDIVLAFMRLPDGCQYHVGCGDRYNGDSIERLWNGDRSTSTTVDGSSLYTRDEIIDVLRQLMERFSPRLLRLQNFAIPIDPLPPDVPSFYDNDHPDHHAAAYFGFEAQRRLASPPQVVGYYGYPIAGRAANVPGELLDAKRNVFLAYGAHDPKACASPCVNPGGYDDWLKRQYTLDPDDNALARPRHPEPPKIMVVGDSISHGDNANQSWRYRLHEHLRLSGTPFDFVGPHNGPNTGTYLFGGWDDDHYAKWGCIAKEIVFPELYNPADLRCDPGHSLNERVSAYQPDVLLVHLGTNDMTYVSSAAGLRDTMRGLIERARAAKPDVDIVFAQIGQVSLFQGAPRAAEFAPLIAELASEQTRPWSRIGVAPVFPTWSMATDTDSGGTHPNVRGEFVIAKAFADTLWNGWTYGAPFGPIALPPLPPKPQNLKVTPNVMGAADRFTAEWTPVANTNPTTYRVELHQHRSYGFGLVWASELTPNTSLTYTGPRLDLAGVYQVVVMAVDQFGQTATSDSVDLTVTGGPPKPTGVMVVPSGPIGKSQLFKVKWDRVVNPNVWTSYRVELHNHRAYGFKEIWRSRETTDLEVEYSGPPLPIAGVYQVVVVALASQQPPTPSDPVDLPVVDGGPPRPTGVQVLPQPIVKSQLFTVKWDRVVNPNVWTRYKVQIRTHRDFGFGVIWESKPTTDTELIYPGDPLPFSGLYHVVVIALDGTYEAASEPVTLDVREGGPPQAAGVVVSPGVIGKSGLFTVSWDRVVSPVWTTYKVQVRVHREFGYGLLWESAETKDTTVFYNGEPLPFAGTYNVVVLALDGTYQSTSVPAELQVRDGGPARPAGVIVDPGTVPILYGFTVRWPVNADPGTLYRVEVRFHRDVGYGLLWASYLTRSGVLSDFFKPSLPGIYHVVVVASADGLEAASAPVPLEAVPQL